VSPRRHSPAVYARRRAVAATLLLGVLAAIVWYVWFTPNEHDAPGKNSVSASSPDASTAPTPTTSSSGQAPPTPSPIPGYLLIADRGNDRAMLVNSSKDRLWIYPKPGTNPSFPFNFDDDTFFAKNYSQIITNQEDQQTIEVISFPQGRVIWHYGHVNVKGSSPGYMNTPDDAYLLPNGNVSVADVYNCRILFISPDKRIVRQIGTTGACAHNPPHNLDSPNGDTPMPDGATLVTEINGSWIDAIAKNGKLMWSVQAPVRYPSDAQWLGDGRILLADYSKPGHVLIMTTGGKVLWKYGPPSGPAALNHPSLALMLPNGLIAANDDYRHRVVIIDPKKHRIVWQYGHTDHPGTAPGYLNTPDGMDFLPFQTALASPAIRKIVLHQ
jgi:hypothetical protein